MRSFVYDQHLPCPTDKWVLEIARDYHILKTDIAHMWRKGVINQLMMYREYADLEDVRLSMKRAGRGSTAVISLKPVLGAESENELNRYESFFRVYTQLRDLLIGVIGVEILRCIDLSKEEIKRTRSTEFISTLINRLYLVVSAMNAGTYTEHVEQVLTQEKDQSLIDDFLRSLEVSHVIGDNFVNGQPIGADIKHERIGAFYKNVRVRLNKVIELHHQDTALKEDYVKLIEKLK